MNRTEQWAPWVQQRLDAIHEQRQRSPAWQRAEEMWRAVSKRTLVVEVIPRRRVRHIDGAQRYEHRNNPGRTGYASWSQPRSEGRSADLPVWCRKGWNYQDHARRV